MVMGLLSPPTGPADNQRACRYANSLRSENIPVAPASKATEIVHAAVIGTERNDIGYVLLLRNGRTWYEDWQAGMTQFKPVQSDAKLVLRTLGINKYERLSVGTLYPLKSVSLSALMQAGLQVQSCY
jgi:hypothetical protein